MHLFVCLCIHLSVCLSFNQLNQSIHLSTHTHTVAHIHSYTYFVPSIIHPHLYREAKELGTVNRYSSEKIPVDDCTLLLHTNLLKEAQQRVLLFVVSCVHLICSR